MMKPSFAGISIKPTTSNDGKMTFKFTEEQWQQFQANQAKAASQPVPTQPERTFPPQQTTFTATSAGDQISVAVDGSV